MKCYIDIEMYTALNITLHHTFDLDLIGLLLLWWQFYVLVSKTTNTYMEQAFQNMGGADWQTENNVSSDRYSDY